jgi:hypothetical protein
MGTSSAFFEPPVNRLEIKPNPQDFKLPLANTESFAVEQYAKLTKLQEALPDLTDSANFVFGLLPKLPEPSLDLSNSLKDVQKDYSLVSSAGEIFSDYFRNTNNIALTNREKLSAVFELESRLKSSGQDFKQVFAAFDRLNRDLPNAQEQATLSFLSSFREETSTKSFPEGGPRLREDLTPEERAKREKQARSQKEDFEKVKKLSREYENALSIKINETRERYSQLGGLSNGQKKVLESTLAILEAEKKVIHRRNESYDQMAKGIAKMEQQGQLYKLHNLSEGVRQLTGQSLEDQKTDMAELTNKLNILSKAEAPIALSGRITDAVGQDMLSVLGGFTRVSAVYKLSIGSALSAGGSILIGGTNPDPTWTAISGVANLSPVPIPTSTIQLIWGLADGSTRI